MSPLDSRFRRAGGRLLVFGALLGTAALPSQSVPVAQAAPRSCNLANGIDHVFYIQFDNTHLRRDKVDVPSDIEQIPHLLSFMKDNGTLLSNDHTILISHTAGGFTTSPTGLYPDRNGLGVTNSYGYFSGVGSSGISFSSAFKYWTDLVDDVRNPPTDPRTNMITDTGKNTPAPWVPFTRAGCDVGGVGYANIELENTGTGPAGDMTEVFGANSPEWTEATTAAALPNTPANAKAIAQPSADFVGLAIHCAQHGSICDNATGARPDLLPDEPGGYGNYKGLFGAKYIDPLLTGKPTDVPLADLFQQPIVDAQDNPGFPGFDGMEPNVSLAYAAAMHEAGVQVTYTYISDAHDNHGGSTLAFGPGQPEYEQQLQRYDQAFADFFADLSAHGINQHNSLFIFTIDEGDHFSGGTSNNGQWNETPCNLTTTTTCPANQIGEIDANLTSLLSTEAPGTAPSGFAIHSDSAPVFYVPGQPAPNDPNVRKFEHGVFSLTVPDPYLALTPGGPAVNSPLVRLMADPIDEKLLHMVNADPLRTATFTVFANPDVFVQTSNTNCPTNPSPVCADPAFAWNHGDVAPDIANVWIGMVGPGVKHSGEDDVTWADHVDARPTLMTLVGLKDDYHEDGRVLLPIVDDRVLPNSLRDPHDNARVVGDVYKQLDAPFGEFDQASLQVSTAALQSGTPADDSRYTMFEARLKDLGDKRDAVADRIREQLWSAEFNNRPIDDNRALDDLFDAEDLLGQMNALAAQAATP